MDWTAVCEDPILQDIPYKIELNEWGNIVMTPASNRHGGLQAEIAYRMKSLMNQGRVISECSVATFKGVKVADVAWLSPEFIARNRGRTPYIEAPEVCVEIKSPSNSLEEMMEKKELYLAKGAKEFWVCDESGQVRFYNHRGELEISAIFPEMTKTIIVDV